MSQLTIGYSEGGYDTYSIITDGVSGDSPVSMSRIEISYNDKKTQATIRGQIILNTAYSAGIDSIVTPIPFTFSGKYIDCLIQKDSASTKTKFSSLYFNEGLLEYKIPGKFSERSALKYQLTDTTKGIEEGFYFYRPIFLYDSEKMQWVKIKP
jgi:hypothetical protein